MTQSNQNNRDFAGFKNAIKVICTPIAVLVALGLTGCATPSRPDISENDVKMLKEVEPTPNAKLPGIKSMDFYTLDPNQSKDKDKPPKKIKELFCSASVEGGYQVENGLTSRYVKEIYGFTDLTQTDKPGETLNDVLIKDDGNAFIHDEGKGARKLPSDQATKSVVTLNNVRTACEDMVKIMEDGVYPALQRAGIPIVDSKPIGLGKLSPYAIVEFRM